MFRPLTGHVVSMHQDAIIGGLVMEVFV